MALSFQEALDWLNDNPNASVADLQSLINDTSIEIPGSGTPLLHSGAVDGTKLCTMTEGLAEDFGLATIGHMDTAKLLNSCKFKMTPKIGP